MEYKGFDALLNKYPDRESYTKDIFTKVDGLAFADESIILSGNYPQNTVEFPIPPLEDIEVVSGTKFKFVIALRWDIDDIDIIGLYTSPTFFTEMATSINENNPYFTQNGLNPNLLTTYYVNEILPLYNSLVEEEKDIGVDVSKNVFISNTGEYDFNELFKYIDWVVSKPKLEEAGGTSVLSVASISQIGYREYNTDEDQYETVDAALKEIKINQLNSELTNINEALGELELFINNPDPTRIRNSSGIAKLIGGSGIDALKAVNVSLLKGLVAKIGLGATLGPIGLIAGLLVGGLSILIGNRKKKKQAELEAEAVLNKMKAEIRYIKELKQNVENELKSLQD